MLARLLRYVYGSQMLLGAALAYWLASQSAHALWAAVLGALALPAAIMWGICLYSAYCARPGESALLWWRALCGECLAALQIFMLRQPWSFAPPRMLSPTSGQARIPVVLVHGFICNARLWDTFIPLLRSRGHPVLAVHLEPVFASIDGYAPVLEQAVQTLREHSGRDQVALVGHSMGGLAIRTWMRRYGTAHATRAITLGTPHAGTRLGRRPLFLNAKQMVWHSPWLGELAATESETTRSLFRIGLTSHDNIVYPQRAQTLPGVEPMVFAGLGHLQLCTAPVVSRWVCAELAGL